MSRKKSLGSKMELVSVPKKFREAHSWFEKGSEEKKKKATEIKQAKVRVLGRQLSANRLQAISDQLERIQRKLNPLENRHAKLSRWILAHWGFTGIQEVEGKLGRTLVHESFQFALNQDVVKGGLTADLWERGAPRRLEPARILVLAKESESLRFLVLKALRVQKPKISITPPSSRRPKSGQAEEG